jgi:hypothetical protein
VNVSRARFLKICVALVAGRNVDASSIGCSVGGALAAAPVQASTSFQVEHATAAMFQAHLNTPFAVRSAGGIRLPLRLTRVTERPLTRGIEQFSLSFQAPAGSLLPHGTHAFRHSALGTFDLFVSPVGGVSAQSRVYEACFSRDPGAGAGSRRPGRERGTLGGDIAC